LDALDDGVDLVFGGLALEEAGDFAAFGCERDVCGG